MAKKKESSKKASPKKTAAKKSTKRKNSKKNTLNYTGLAAGLFAVCIILIAVFLFIKPAVEQDKIKNFSGRTQDGIENKSSVRQGEIQSPLSENKNEKLKDNVKKDRTETADKPSKPATSEKPVQSEGSAKLHKSEPSEKTEKPKTGGAGKEPRPEPAKDIPKPVKPSETESIAKVAANEGNAPIKDLPELPEKGRLIFVFDDAGHSLEQLKLFLDLPFPCTIAVLPRLAHSAEAAKRIRSSGKELILHQPMQSVNLNINPGEGSIQPGMSAEEIRQIVSSNIEEIAPVAGMNNHEGSLITSDENAMRVVLELCREKNIYFLDSRTTAKSVVPKTAKEMNFKIWERAVFLDNEKTVEHLQKQIAQGLEIASARGSAIMIGHIFTPQLAILLKEMYPELIKEGYSFSTISKENRASQ
ncbi:divergent polysaccharide deacetylase family protein [Treponema pedis]|uniref:Divergent polysaccharide deacetylase n=1 Tax=Treponema pedis str. T A4 TaxID=1291379 RepID=S6A3I8_9SPIR|nr:divergent polysaccharide deacetylase family protein [Treponema pedis]AGT43596.1 hypothetical protein TPE_1100 [Treponema pedis str. T A4]